jgi:hypothetical protein
LLFCVFISQLNKLLDWVGKKKGNKKKKKDKPTSETHKHDVISLKISSWTSKYINAESRERSEKAKAGRKKTARHSSRIF